MLGLSIGLIAIIYFSIGFIVYLSMLRHIMSQCIEKRRNKITREDLIWCTFSLLVWPYALYSIYKVRNSNVK